MSSLITISIFILFFNIHAKMSTLGTDTNKLFRNLSERDQDDEESTRSFIEGSKSKNKALKSTKDEDNENNAKQGVLLTSETLNPPLLKALEEDKNTSVSIKSINRLNELVSSMNNLQEKVRANLTELGSLFANFDKEKEKSSERLDMRIIEVDDNKKSNTHS